MVDTALMKVLCVGRSEITPKARLENLGCDAKDAEELFCEYKKYIESKYGNRPLFISTSEKFGSMCMFEGLLTNMANSDRYRWGMDTDIFDTFLHWFPLVQDHYDLMREAIEHYGHRT